MEFVGIDKMSLVDYDDKIAVTLFTEGCNFRCPFCHNGPLVFAKNNIHLNWDEIKAYLIERKKVIDAVVISGGEPTIHIDLADKIREIKELGYLVKLDTNGTNPDLLKYLVNNRLIDYVAMDIKNAPNKYAKTIGKESCSLDKINESIFFLLEDHIDYEFRTTVMDEFHTKEDFMEIGKWIKGAKKYRIQKYTDRDECIAHGFKEIKKEEAESIASSLKEFIADVSLRGY